MIRKACEKDIERILELLKQVNKVHYDGRPDLFKLDTKYTYNDLKLLLIMSTFLLDMISR